MKSFALLIALISLVSFSAQARVYKNVKVGEYKSVIDLNDYKGVPFIEVMKDVIYPEINAEAANQSAGWGGHLNAIKDGEGVELFLTSDVTTYHVKYLADDQDKVERSGRSFGAIGEGNFKKYIADASYKHYLRELQKVLEGTDEEVVNFYTAILNVITDSDPSGIELLDTDAKQVAADFVAIYVAEQYRRLTATKGEYLGRSHRWDNALVQVTLVAAFHSGQENMMMFYEGEFTGEVYNQGECLYRAKDEEERRATTEKREARLYDYWQFTVRSECPGRSGVNLTRRDFEKLGKALTNYIYDVNGLVGELELDSSYEYNFIKAATKDLLNGNFGYKANDFTNILVDVLMTVRTDAEVISEELLN